MSSATAAPLASPTTGVPRVWGPWLAAWLGATVIAIANGIARRALYEDRVGPMAAHYLSTGLLLALFGGYFWWLGRRWPIPTRRTALAIGGTWAALTIAFEFGLGRFVVGDPWPKLLEQYDLSRGYVWVLVPLWTAVGPVVTRRPRRGDPDRDGPDPPRRP